MKINVITHNPGKVREYQSEFDEFGIEMVHVNREYDEVQTSYLEEVVDKGMKQLRNEGLKDFLVDDSGLFIDSLGGFPGVYSAFVQKTIGNKGVLKLMDGVKNRSAVFKCCIGCTIGEERIVVTGICPGEILLEEKGNGGFGYDPIFSLDGELSFAEISTETKNGISHRGKAVRMLIEEMKKKDLLRSGLV